METDAPEKLHVVIGTSQAWIMVVEALKNLASGGRIVISTIRNLALCELMEGKIRGAKVMLMD